jgi:midasin (ATPase involved in ribosome maturation)
MKLVRPENAPDGNQEDNEDEKQDEDEEEGVFEDRPYLEGKLDAPGMDVDGTPQQSFAASGLDGAMGDGKSVTLSDTDLAALRSDLEDKLAVYRAYPEQHKALEIWQTLCFLSNDVSHALCEQLRMVLEPSLATRLKGDYRTGKRINIKRIIPYIASGFRKDKIWLRRNKPNKRSYQVMVCIDDSKSMDANGAGVLALEALVVISNALNKLEVGQVAICKFGERLEMLHAFDQPFTSAAGAYAVSQFKFDQQETGWAPFLESCIDVSTSVCVCVSVCVCE